MPVLVQDIACGGIDSALELKFGLQAIAQVFRATQTSA
jgi:hypothetical protein